MRFQLSADQIEYLTSEVDSKPRQEFVRSLPTYSKAIGCCVDTLKRLLVRHNILIFHGEKYVISRTTKEQVWSRPCMKCKCEKLRPKNQYICNNCKEDYHGI